MTQLALVLGGSASLGAYTGGALDEVCRALARNRRRDGAALGVLTGASSGAMAAALGARAAVVNPELVPWAEKFWRHGLRDELLLDADRTDRSGWLSAGPLEELLGELVAGAPASDDRPAAFLGEELHLGFSLQRLDPAPSVTDGRPGEEVVFRLDRSHGAGHPVWGEILEAALAGGSLPFLFPPRPPRASRGGAAEGGPRVGDGLATERPLALARRLTGGHPSRDEDWRFLVVAPGLSAEDVAGRPADTADVARLFARSATGRGMALDLLRAAGEEERAELLRGLVHRLPDIHGRLDDPAAVGLGRRVGELAERVAEWEVERGAFPADSPDPVLDHLDRELERIQGRSAYAPAFADVEGRAGRTRMAKLVYVLEAVAALRDRQDRPVHLVAPDGDRPLAGRAMAGLGGWFSSSARHADFDAGRRDARRVLEGALSDVVRYDADPDDASVGERTGEGPFRMTREERERLRAFLAREVDRRLDEVSPDGLRGVFFGWARTAVRRRAVDGLLERLGAG